MRYRLTPPDIKAYERGTERFVARAVTGGVDDTTLWLKNALRQQILAAGLPQRLANVVRSKRYPQRGDALDAAGLVYERPKKPGSEVADLVNVFNTGVTIYAVNRRFLAIPTTAAQQGRYPESGNKRHRVTPAAFEQATGLDLHFVLGPPGKPSFLVADMARTTPKGFARRAANPRKGRSVVIFILLPMVRLRKRLDWLALSLAASEALPGNIARHWK